MLLALWTALAAAAPDDPWRTARTEHYEVHYPEAAEDWALAAASRLEAVHARVEEAVGFELDGPVTVVVRDPYATANGFAVPFLDGPRTELWVTPPGAASPIGWNRRWDEGLTVHEITHLVHLSQPARGGVSRFLDAVVGFGPIARTSPAWVVEGYATLVEGDLTGFGRPYAAAQAAEIRHLATEGRLPTYGELSGTFRYGGGSFPYGMGAAFLAWLRDRAGPDSLHHLWRRMSAKKLRGFDEAFIGVFGDPPEALYGRFTAEVTAAAMAHEAARPPLDGTTWIDLEGSTGAPDVSPDGEKLVLVVDQDDTRVLTVYGTTPPDEARGERDAAIAALLERDPEDVPDVAPEAPPLEVLHERGRQDRSPRHPRWVDDETVIFSGLEPDARGRLRRDLFLWRPDAGETRLTRGEDLIQPDPSRDGTSAVAVRLRWGATGLVRVDLETGQVTEWLAPSVERTVDSPRISPDGTRVAWLQMEDAGWRLRVAPLDDPAAARDVPLPPGAQVATPTWHPDGEHLVVSLGTDTLVDLAQVPLDGGPVGLWTRSHGGAFAPTLHGEHVYWLDEDAYGRDVHRTPIPATPEPLPDDLPRGPGMALEAPPQVALPAVEPVTGERYGLGPTESRILTGGVLAQDRGVLTLGLRLGDPVGRHELLVRGALARRPDETDLGGWASWTLESLPVAVHVDGWGGSDVGQVRAGAALALQDTHRWTWGGVRARGGLLGSFRDDAPSLLGTAEAGLGLWDETRDLLGLELEGRAVAGTIGADRKGWTRARLHLWLFDRWMGLSGTGHLGLGEAVALGGIRPGWLPDRALADRVIDPALPRDALVTDQLLQVEATLGPDAGFFLRHAQDLTPGGRGVLLLGLAAHTRLPAQPFLRIPAAELGLGVACLVDDPLADLDQALDGACRSEDDWTGWLGLTWTR